MSKNSEVIESIKNLRSDRNPNYWDSRTKGRAPHKPILLLSIVDGIEQGWIKGNRIELSQELIDTFFTYWNGIMGEDRNTTIALPFFHMKTEPFWQLQYKPGKDEYKSSPSIGGLKDRIEYAVVDEKLFELMSDPIDKLRIRKLLAETYFPDEVSGIVKEIASFNLQAWDYAGEIESMAAEPFVADHSDKKEKKFRKSYSQIRETGFSLVVRKNYDYTCAICRNRVVTPENQTLVEGAHIIPWSQSNNDDPRNGISLCRSHHWMFDQMMITIQPDFMIRLSGWLEKENNRVEDTLQWSDREIMLPGNRRFLPSEEALSHHNERFKDYQANY